MARYRLKFPKKQIGGQKKLREEGTARSEHICAPTDKALSIKRSSTAVARIGIATALREAADIVQSFPNSELRCEVLLPFIVSVVLN